MSFYSGYLVNNIRNLQGQNIERDNKNHKREKNISKFFKDTQNRVDSISNVPYKYPTSIYSQSIKPSSSSLGYNYADKKNYLQNNYSYSYGLPSSLTYNKNLSNSVFTTYEDISDKYYGNKNQKKLYDNDSSTNNNRELYYITTSTVGLTNLGNTCFMNTCLQILIHSEDFIQRLLTKSSSLSKYTPITYKFYNLCKEMLSSQRSINPTEFKQKFGSKHSLFRGYGQNDTQEFCRILLEDMNVELNEVSHKAAYEELITKGKSKIQCDQEFDELFRRRESSIVMDSFYGQLINIFTCTCNYQSYSFQKVLDLPLLLGNNDIYDLLDDYFKKESIDFETKCENCKKRKRRHIKETKISRPPNILILSFQRINWRTQRKNNCKVTFYEELNIQRYIDEECGHGNEYKYTLYGIGNHSGTINFGHYYAYIKLNNKTWYEFNDSMVSKIGYIDTNSSNAYTLFYKKKI